MLSPDCSHKVFERMGGEGAPEPDLLLQLEVAGEGVTLAVELEDVEVRVPALPRLCSCLLVGRLMALRDSIENRSTMVRPASIRPVYPC